MAAAPSRAAIRSKGQSLGAELQRNHDALVANPKELAGYIARNAELSGFAKDAQVATDLSRNNTTMADILRLQSKKLTSLAPMTPVAFMKGLLRMFPASGGEGVDWVAFGTEASVHFREPPAAHSMYHMSGAYGMEAKTAKVAAKRAVRAKDENLEEEKTTMTAGVDETEEEKNADTLRNAARSTMLHRELQALMLARGRRVIVRAPDDGMEWEVPDALPMVDVLFDPYSYTNTVENLFYYAALVKEGFGTVLWARVPAGAADKPGKQPAEGHEWEPYITVCIQQDLQRALERPMVPPGAAKVVDPPPRVGLAPFAAAAKPSPGRAAKGGGADAQRRIQGAAERQRAVSGRSTQFVVEVDLESWEALCKKKGLAVPAVSCRRTVDTRAPAGFQFAVDAKSKGAGGGGGARKKAKHADGGEITEPEEE